MTISKFLLFSGKVNIFSLINTKKLDYPVLLKGDIVQLHFTGFYKEKFWNYQYWSHTVLYIGNDEYIHSIIHDGLHLSNDMSQTIHEIKSNTNWNYAISRVTYNKEDINNVIDFANLRINERRYDFFLCFFHNL